MRTWAKILLDADSWYPEHWELEFEFTGRIKYIKYPTFTRVFFEVKYFQKRTPFVCVWEIWKWFLKPEKTEIIEFLPENFFKFDFEDERVITITEC